MMAHRTTQKEMVLVLILAAAVLLLWPAWLRSADCPVCPDPYETDDAFWQAKNIAMNDPVPQLHNFHDEGDQDWVEFAAIKGQWYEIVTHDLGNAANTVLELYTGDGITRIRYCDDNWTADGKGEEISWKCPKTGTYFLKVRQSNPLVFGADTDYNLRVYVPVQPVNTGFMRALAFNSKTKEPLTDVVLVVNDPDFLASASGPNGYLGIQATRGNYAFTAKKAGFRDTPGKIKVVKGVILEPKLIPMKPN